jgi:putative FmdB family regulatory protein
MPIFEYVCKQCESRFELLVGPSAKAACPECRSEELRRQLSVFAVGSAPAGGRRAAPVSPCGRCGDPRGPGACALD